MKSLLLLLSASLVVSTTTTAQDCPFEIGESVEPRDFSNVFEKLNQVSIEKDEFETTQEYEARIKALRFGNPVLIESEARPYYSRYEADHNRFVMTRYFFDPETIWALIYDDLPKAYRKVSHASDYQITGALTNGKTKENLMGTGPYDLIFEAVHSSRYPAINLEWLFDKKSYRWRKDSRWKEEVIFVDVPRERAEEIVDQMRVAYYVVPKPPFKLEILDRYDSRVLFADIHCAMIMDPDGVVLRVVERNTKKNRKKNKRKRKEEKKK